MIKFIRKKKHSLISHKNCTKRRQTRINAGFLAMGGRCNVYKVVFKNVAFFNFRTGVILYDNSFFYVDLSFLLYKFLALD